ncbi:MAG: winged helix DNA-binding domain-containing protein [Proteobacteria bacterium]|nr:winged helix DNA-binding domain-containing protein [Pseudomonadota bacterium]
MAKPPATTYPLSRLRRLALERQGLLKKAPFGRGIGATLKAIEHIGYVQIDTISVVARAHHHVLRSRVPNYEPAHLDRLIKQRKVFEYWYHAAAYLPMRDYAHARIRMQAMRKGEERWVRSRDTRLMKRVLDQIRAEGPVRSRDFESDPPPGADPGWWNWNPTKRALEQLFMQGDLMVSGREGFQKTYDLTEHCLPSDIPTTTPSISDHAAYLVDTTLRANGFATLKSFTHLRKGPTIRAAVKIYLDQLMDEGQVITLKTADGASWFGYAEMLDTRAAQAPASVRILSPFDNALILRHRGVSIFDFDYQIECYVKAENRRFGYFCLPITYRDRFVGRVDAKAHRERGELELKGVFIEHAVDAGFADAFAEAIGDFAHFNGCEQVTLTKVSPGRYRTAIEQALMLSRTH